MLSPRIVLSPVEYESTQCWTCPVSGEIRRINSMSSNDGRDGMLLDHYHDIYSEQASVFVNSA